MIIDRGNGFYSIYAHSLEYPLKLDGVDRWIKYLKYGGSTPSRNSTIKSYVEKLEKFFYWTLTNVIEDEDLFELFYRFREQAKVGFTIYCPIIIDGKTVYYEYAKVGPMSEESVLVYEAAVYSYFGVVNKLDKKSLYTDIKNSIYTEYIQKYGKLSSLNIKVSTEDQTYKKRRGALYNSLNPRNFRAFPKELFDALIEMANPREKLIYLLCGGTSARVGQVLNLTLYDINFERRQVRLIDPRSDTLDDYGNRRKNWLLEKYNIDIFNNPMHNTNDLQFKYRIPYSHTYLFWLNEDKYKVWFFKELVKYLENEYIHESDRTFNHPFFFITKTSRRYRQTYINQKFHKHCSILAEKYPLFKERLTSLKGLHSLRHMCGRVMAEQAIESRDYNVIFYAAEVMGHSNLSSIFDYFYPEEYEIRKLLQEQADLNNKEIKSHEDIRFSMKFAFGRRR